MVTIEEYREMLKDYTSTDKQIKNRIDYLEAYCRSIVRQEIEDFIEEKIDYEQSTKNKRNRKP